MRVPVLRTCARAARLPVFDLVLLRNVLLYFPQQDRSCVFSDVYRQMSPRGYLVLGNAEQAEDSTNLFQAELGADWYFYTPGACQLARVGARAACVL